MSNQGITKKAIANAMKTLMYERPMSKINVSDIVELCDLNRNSFYYHFKDKYDLVNWIFYTDMVSEFKNEEVENLPRWNILERLCKFFYEDRAFYVSALSVTGQNSFKDYFREFIKKFIIIRIPDFEIKSEEDEFFIEFTVETLTNIILKWLQKGANISPENFVNLIKKSSIRMAKEIVNDI